MKTIDLSKSVWVPWMRRAIQLAALADGQTSPNPLVGAVVLAADGTLVGEGFHSKAGRPHAETEALSQAGDRSRGGTIVVTLEPCCHEGRTPPCTEQIINAGLSRVVVALKDPDPRVSGSGLARLKEAGLEVVVGVLEEEASSQNKAFLFRTNTGRPLGILKWAMSIDGRTALPNGASQWISCSKSRDWVHLLRSKCDAVIVGGATVRSDNPLLTSRGLSAPEPLRVVFTKTLDLPLTAKVWDTSIANTLIAYSSKNVVSRDLSRFPKGADYLALETSTPAELMHALAKKGCNRILWECGPALATAAIQQGCVQELAAVISPKLLGGASARTPVGDFGFTAMDEVYSLQNQSLEKLGTDWLLKMNLNEGHY